MNNAITKSAGRYPLRHCDICDVRGGPAVADVAMSQGVPLSENSDDAPEQLIFHQIDLGDIIMTIDELAAALGIRLTSKTRAAICAYAQRESAAAVEKVRVDAEIDRTLTVELSARGGNAALLMPILRGRVKGHVDASDQVVLVPLDAAGDDMHGKSVVDLIETLRRDKTFGKAFSAAVARRPGQVNPWRRETWSLTEQSRIGAENSTLADQLRREAKSDVTPSATVKVAPLVRHRGNPWKKETRNLTEQSRIRAENPALADQLKREAEQA